MSPSVRIYLCSSIKTTSPHSLYASLRLLLHACITVKKHVPYLAEMGLSFSYGHNYFHNQCFMPLPSKESLVIGTYTKPFSALYLTTVCIESFTSNNTHFSVSFPNTEWNIIPRLNIVLNTLSLPRLSCHKWYSFFANAFISTTNNSVSSFEFYVVCTFNESRVLAN